MAAWRYVASGITLGAVLLFADAARADPRLLLGGWRCQAMEDGATMLAEVEYVRNGQSSFAFAISGVEQGAQFTVEGFGTGSWDLEGDDLLETIDDVAITSLMVNGQALPPEAFPEDLKRVLFGASSSSTVVRLNQDALITRPSLGGEVSCIRIR